MLELQRGIERPWKRQRLRVPRDDGAVFARPELHACTDAVRRNAEKLNSSSADVQGRTLAHLREWSRRILMEQAREYTAAVVDSAPGPAVSRDAETGPIILGGHQPSLFHAGVWIKNFAIHYLAQRTGGASVNLVVDNDAVSSSTIRVPAGDRDQPRIERIAFDRERMAGPWEDARVADFGLFASFGDRVAQAMASWSIQPVLAEIWPDVVQQVEETASLRDGFTAGRGRLERRWGLRNLELPLSRVCEADPFLWFASHLFAHADRFRTVHNTVLDEYRAVNRVRSRTHPVPELIDAGGWLESPFWVFREGSGDRGRLMVRSSGREVALAVGNETIARLPLSREMDACCAVEVLRDLPARGIRIRTRALSTTLFARLCFGDLFVHGIGGAKYDEMTDRMIARFFKIRAPEFLTLSATLRLPLGEPFPVSNDDLIRLQAERRDMRYNPDRHFAAQPSRECEALIAEKQRLIHTGESTAEGNMPRSERRRQSAANFTRYRRLREISERLNACTATQRAEIEREIENTRDALAANAVLLDREFSFGLFPAEKLRTLMQSAETQIAG